MAIIQETSGEQFACDGCGRVDSDVQPLDIQPVQNTGDPNIDQNVAHHFCVQCAANRGLAHPSATASGAAQPAQ